MRLQHGFVAHSRGYPSGHANSQTRRLIGISADGAHHGSGESHAGKTHGRMGLPVDNPKRLGGGAQFLTLGLQIVSLASAHIPEPENCTHDGPHSSEPSIRPGVIGRRWECGFRVHDRTHIGQHDEGHLLGLVKRVQVTLEVVLLEDQPFPMDLCLSILGIETKDLGGRREGGEEGEMRRVEG